MDVPFPIPPFASLMRPSIGLSLLHAQLKRMGFFSAVKYYSFDLDLADRTGVELYNWLAYGGTNDSTSDITPESALAGEWFFSDVAFPDRLSSEGSNIIQCVQP